MSKNPGIDVRWQQRFTNFESALGQLRSAVDLSNQRDLSELEKQGLVQAFEYTHELAWNVIKDYFSFQGNDQIAGSRDAAREAFKMGLIENGDPWMEMIKSRNQTTHAYNKPVVEDIVAKIRSSYFHEFCSFHKTMLGKKA